MAKHAVGTRTSDREPINLHNLKPYRSAALRREANERREVINGTFVSSVKKLYHAAPKDAN